MPSAAIRPAALLALAPLLIRRRSSAAFMSPLVSVKAFLHSIMPRPVISRNSFTICAVISAMFAPDNFSKKEALGVRAPAQTHVPAPTKFIPVRRLLPHPLPRNCLVQFPELPDFGLPEWHPQHRGHKDE